jgi:hypothetical protein
MGRNKVLACRNERRLWTCQTGRPSPACCSSASRLRFSWLDARGRASGPHSTSRGARQIAARRIALRPAQLGVRRGDGALQTRDRQIHRSRGTPPRCLLRSRISGAPLRAGSFVDDASALYALALPRIRDTGRYVADRYLSSAEAAILSFEAACRCGLPHAPGSV